MAKQHFERTKPHVNIGTIGQHIFCVVLKIIFQQKDHGECRGLFCWGDREKSKGHDRYHDSMTKNHDRGGERHA